MAGCFGNHAIDRWLEDELMRHLEDGEKCDGCRFAEFDDDGDMIDCERCHAEDE